jgi:plasmid stabilization system protein ParE
MRFTVVWLPAAEDQLALIWIQAPDQQAVADAANRIERALQSNADRKGVLHEDLRIYFDLPLIVAFEVSLADRLVEIVSVTYRI